MQGPRLVSPKEAFLFLALSSRNPSMATEAKQTAPSDYDEKVGSPGLHDVDTSRGVRKTGSDSLSDLDTYLEGSEGVTVRDLETYRHVADTLPYTAWLVAFVEFAER